MYLVSTDFIEFIIRTRCRCMSLHPKYRLVKLTNILVRRLHTSKALAITDACTTYLAHPFNVSKVEAASRASLWRLHVLPFFPQLISVFLPAIIRAACRRDLPFTMITARGYEFAYHPSDLPSAVSSLTISI